MEQGCKEKLNIYCQKHNVKLLYDDIDVTGPSHDPEFTIAVKINGKEYGRGTGKNKKEAKAVAAKNAWEKLENPSNMQAAELTPRVKLTVPDMDYVSLLNRYSQRTRHIVDYHNKGCIGDPHAPKFSCSCVISGSVLGFGTGSSRAAAKQAAAKQAFEKLKEEGNFTMENEKSNSNSFSEHSNSFQVLSHSDGVYFEDSGELLEKVKAMAVCENPSPAPRDAQSCVQKSKRILAANFDHARNEKEKKEMLHSDNNFPDLDMNASEENGSQFTVNKRFLESFKNIEPIGDGGFGKVFKATGKLDKKTYAIKRVQFTKNVEREVKELARLEHEHIVRYYGSWEGCDYETYSGSRQRSDREIACLFIQMELCEQGTLENWMDKHRQDRNYHEMAQNKYLQILEGVNYIHSEGLIHRDLKPQNMFISREDKIKIGDFGLVTSVEYGILTENRGTKSYMAPEQVGDRYGNKVDIYAMGLIWFEILSKFSYHEKMKMWPDARDGQLPENFSNHFPAEASIIKKMLSKDPRARYSASEILKFLKSVAQDNSFRTHTQ